MKRIRLTESDLVRIIEKVVREEESGKRKFVRAPKSSFGSDHFRDENDLEVKFNPEGKVGRLYNNLKDFKREHPDLFYKYFGTNDDDQFDIMGSVDKPQKSFDYLGGEFEVFDEEAKLEEMKKRVKVMENNLRRKKQLRRR